MFVFCVLSFIFFKAGFQFTLKDLVFSLLIFPKLLIAVVGAKAPPPLSQPDQHDEVRYYVREVEQCRVESDHRLDGSEVFNCLIADNIYLSMFDSAGE